MPSGSGDPTGGRGERHYLRGVGTQFGRDFPEGHGRDDGGVEPLVEAVAERRELAPEGGVFGFDAGDQLLQADGIVLEEDDQAHEAREVDEWLDVDVLVVHGRASGVAVAVEGEGDLDAGGVVCGRMAEDGVGAAHEVRDAGLQFGAARAGSGGVRHSSRLGRGSLTFGHLTP